MVKKKSKKKTVAANEATMRRIESAAVASVSDGLVSAGALALMRKNAIPADLTQQIKKAQERRQNNDFMQALMNIKVNFGYAGFHNDTDDPEARRYYDEIAETHDFDSLILNLREHAVTTDNLLLHWKMGSDTNNKKNLKYVTALDPGLVKVTTAFGEAIVYVEPDMAMKKFVQSKGTTKSEKELLKSIPEKWQEAARGHGEPHKNFAELSEEDNEFVIIKNTKGYNDRIISPSMNAVHFDLDLFDNMIDGDAQVALYTKAMIMHMKGGESITSGQNAGSTKNWLKQGAIDKMEAHVKSISKAQRLITQHHWTIDFVFPDQRYWTSAKYDAVIKRILRWAGIGESLLIGEGGNFAVSYINIKGIKADIMKINRITSRAIEEFYRRIKPSNIKKDAVPNVVFDTHMLKEPKNLLEEVKLLVKQGPMSSGKALEIFGYSPRIEAARKKEELKNPDLTTPLVEPGQGNSIISQKMQAQNIKNQSKEKQTPGRKQEKPGVQPTEQQPRPSTSEALDELGYEGDMAPFKGLPVAAFKIWEKVYKAAKHAGDSEEKAAKKAWGAVKHSYKKAGDKWVKSK